MSERSRVAGIVAGLLILLLLLVPAWLAWMGRGYLYQVTMTCLIFVILSASLHLVTGVTGLLQLGQAAFYGIGAYTAALLVSRLGWGFAVSLPAAGLIAAFFALLIALPTMRLLSIYFAVATLAVGQMVFLVMQNWVGLTNGPDGVILSGSLTLFGLDLGAPAVAYEVIALATALSVWVIHRLSHSYYANALRALREDDQCADAMGIDTVRLKVECFVISGFFAGIAGGLWAMTTSYVSPADFDFNQSILILVAVVLGGLGSLPGAVIGALILILLPEVLRPIGNIRSIAIGAVLFVTIIAMPKGLIGEVSALEFARRQLGGAWRLGVGWR